MARCRTSGPTRRGVLLGLVLGASSIGPGVGAAKADDDPWPSLAPQIFGQRALEDDGSLVAIDAPYRAEDAAIVPITLHLLPGAAARQVRALTVVIDANPSPLAAVFTLPPEAGIASIATRVRVDSYTNIHVVAEAADGSLHATKRYVKAAGGCSAPAMKQEQGTISLGTLRFREFAAQPGAESGLREAELMVRHPNYSGMQMDQLTRLYIPAHFVKTARLWQGDAPLLAIESGISLSENPSFRFSFRPNGARTIRAEVVDNEDKTFRGEWPVASA